MLVPPMRPTENLLAVVAALLVIGALLPWELRLACAIGAIGIAILLAAMRGRAHSAGIAKAKTASVYGQVERMRAARKKRLDRKTR